jgi:hypothetical protein
MYTKVFGWKGIATVTFAVLIAMTSNVIFQKSIGSPNGVLFSNYSETLYGLASGNAGYARIYEDHPNVNYNDIYGLALDKIRREPGLLFQGMAGAFKDYFTGGMGAFSFLRLVNDKNTGNYSLWILTWAGIATFLCRPKKALSWMMLFAFIGILFSTFLLPPIDANYMRVYAATFPFTAFLAASGLGFPETLFQKSGFSVPASFSEWKTDSWLLPYSVGLLSVCLVSPLIVKLIQNPMNIRTSVGCAPNEVEILFRMGNHSSINILNDVNVGRSFVPDIKVSVFRESMFSRSWTYPHITQELKNLEPGYSVSIGGFYMISPQRSDGVHSGFLLKMGEPLPAGDHQICVIPASDENLKGSFFYYVSAPTTAAESLAPRNELPFTNWIRRFYGLILFVIALSLFDFWSLNPSRKLFLIGILFLIITSVFIHLHNTNIYPLIRARQVLKTENLLSVGGYGYKLDMEVDWIDGLSPDAPLVVYENGIALKKPNEDLSEIKTLGRGRFSVKDGELFFSASDNSDPRNNGRTYEIHGPTPVSQFIKYVSYLSFLVAIFFLGKHFLLPVGKDDNKLVNA